MPQSVDGTNAFRDFVKAKDLASYLLPGVQMHEFLLWPPNLFALTSYILSLTGAYQLAVSPARGKSWPPDADVIRGWHCSESLKSWLHARVAGPDSPPAEHGEAEARIARYLGNFDCEKQVAEWLNAKRWDGDTNGQNPWIPMVRSCGIEWRHKLVSLDPESLPVALSEEKSEKRTFDEILNRVPVSLLSCWVVFNRLVIEGGKDISKLLCNREDDCYESEEEREEMWVAVMALLSLHAIADEACVGWGIRRLGGESLAERFAKRMLKDRATMATINPDRCRVLPKRHNPNVGITLRSLSSNLAFHRSSIDVIWRESKENPLTRKVSGGETARFHMLLLPWPLHVRSEYFSQFAGTRPVDMNPSTDGFFVYEPRDALYEGDRLRRVLDAARREGGVDMVVLPESAIHSSEVGTLEAALLKSTDEVKNPPISAFIAGVREKPSNSTFHRNAVYCKTAVMKENGEGYYFPPKSVNDLDQSFKQYKHHRWRLNRSQILQYGLSHRLPPQMNWWEGIKVGRRRVSFINIGDKLTICPLICEDLARQDPIADLIRTVGPSLVVTILMDGPQRADRWSSRYASVLSEDPGSAVITLTSYGMVRRCNTLFRSQSNVVALWSDGNGPTRELELSVGADGILVTLDVKPNREQVADGRIEHVATSRVELADVIQIYADEDRH